MINTVIIILLVALAVWVCVNVASTLIRVVALIVISACVVLIVMSYQGKDIDKYLDKVPLDTKKVETQIKDNLKR